MSKRRRQRGLPDQPTSRAWTDGSPQGYWDTPPNGTQPQAPAVGPPAGANPSTPLRATHPQVPGAAGPAGVPGQPRIIAQQPQIPGARPAGPGSWGPGPGAGTTHQGQPNPVGDAARRQTSTLGGLFDSAPIQDRSKRKKRSIKRPGDRPESAQQTVPERASLPATAVWVLAVAATATAAMATIGRGTPAFGHSWQPLGLISGAALTTLLWVGQAHWVRTRGRCAPRVRTATFAVSAVLIAAFWWGATHSVVVNGKPYLDSSATAAAYRLHTKMTGDLQRIAVLHDDLIKPDVAQVRGRTRDLEAAIAELTRMNNSYAKLVEHDYDDETLNLLVSVYVLTTEDARVAAQLKLDILKTADQSAQITLSETQAALAEKFSTIGPALAEVDQRYGFGRTPSETTPGSAE